MSIDRKATNGPGSRRIESGGGDLSTTVQASKHSASFLSELTDKYGGRAGSDSQARTDVGQFAEANVRQLSSAAKKSRQYSKTVLPPPIKGARPANPGAATPHETYVTTTAALFKKGGEKIKG